MLSILASTSVALFLNQVSVPLTSEKETLLYRVCSNISASEVQRCKARQREHLRLSARNSSTNAHEVYNRIDLGQNRLRSGLQERRLERARARAAARRTFRQSPAQQDSSLQPVDYVDYIREQRLECMLITRGRPRSLCLDELNNTARRLSQENAANRVLYSE